MSVLFAYPGQGAQRPGMLAALPDEPPVRACLEQAADCLGQAPAELESAEALRGTRAVQLCLLIAGVAASRLLETRGHRPGLVAGLSIGAYPAAVLYATPAYVKKNPKAVQSLANAFVRGLKWIAANPAEKIADLMPPEYALGNKDNYIRSIRSSLPMYSPDGRIEHAAAETAHKVLSRFDPNVQRAKIDLAATYDNTFVAKAAAR